MMVKQFASSNLNQKEQINWYDLIDYEDAYLLSHDSSADFYRYLDLLDCNGECYPDCETISDFNFETYMEFIGLIKMVKLNKDNWKFSRCTCSDYLKLYLCKHILLVAVSQKLIAIPEKFYDSIIGSKPKPGKKKKAKAWHIVQNY